MHLRFLRGEFTPVDAFATNDFESMLVGDVVDLTGAHESGGCHFESATFNQR
jgi:hypothetical protein